MKIVKLLDDQVKALESYVEWRNQAEESIFICVHRLSETRKRLWGLIRELLPEYGDCDGEIKWETKEIIFRDKEHTPEER